MKHLTTKFIIVLIAIISLPAITSAASLIVPFGDTYNLPPGNSEFDYVSIEGDLVLSGNSDITCVGVDGYFYLASTGIIYNPTSVNDIADNGIDGTDGLDGIPDGGHGQPGTIGGNYTTAFGANGVSLTITTDHDILLYGTINLSGNQGYNHTGFGGRGGHGGHGADGVTSGVKGGNGGSGNNGGHSTGGNGGNSGGLTLIALDGVVNCTDLAVSLIGGPGGNAGTAGSGGYGGDGGDGASAGGNGGNGGNGGYGGNGGNSVGGNGGSGGNMTITAELGITTTNMALTNGGGQYGFAGTAGLRGFGGARGYGGSAGWPFNSGSNGYQGGNGIPGTQSSGSWGTAGSYSETYTGCLAKINEGYAIKADFNLDCYVNILDLGIFAGYWLDCMDPDDPLCDQPWL